MRKRSDSNKCFLCESGATATNVFCAKAERQQQMFSVRKRSDSNKCFCDFKYIFAVLAGIYLILF
ncbi:hypothetical protein [Lysinibacillus sp. NPDC056232]|uniref:hypothetical protein n=1 Tax=Lysinibacillus sp. NPDC056232 TaxID=3345756 RepID=UPI0035D8C092